MSGNPIYNRPSNIDPTHPEAGNASTANVRANFQTAANEIGALNDGADDNQTNIATLQADVATLQTDDTNSQQAIAEIQISRTFSQGQWLWQDAAQSNAGMADGTVGADNTDWTQAATLWIARTSNDPVDAFSPITMLRANDGIVVWEGLNAIRYVVTDIALNYGTYFGIPVAFVSSGGYEFADQYPVYVKFLYTSIDVTELTNSINNSVQASVQASQIYTVGQWLWQDAAQTGPIDSGLVGVDNTDWTVAETLFVSRYAENGTDYFFPFSMLRTGDGLIVWAGANTVRYTLTAGAEINDPWFSIPVTLFATGGYEPDDQSSVYVQFVFSAG